MAEAPKAPAAQPQATPQTGTAPVSPVNQSLSAQGGPAAQEPSADGLRGPSNPNPVATGAAPTRKFAARSPLIMNPEPTREDGELATSQTNPAAPADGGVPASTLAEMEAGRKALERNKPVQNDADRARDDAEKKGD